MNSMARSVVKAVSECASATRAGFPGVAHVPAAHAASVLAGGAVRVQLPRIASAIALGAQVLVVTQSRREHGIGIEPFELLERLEAAADDRPADFAIEIHAQAGKRRLGAAHLHLADQHRRDAEVPHVVPQGQLSQLEGVFVRRCTVRGHVAPGEDAGTGWPAQRRLAVGAGESNPAGGKPVDVRCLQVRMAVAGQVVPPELVAHDEQDVGLVFQRRLRRGESSDRSRQEACHVVWSEPLRNTDRTPGGCRRLVRGSTRGGLDSYRLQPGRIER